MTPPSQCDLILEALQNADGEWVSMPTLAAASRSLNIHSRIANLRDRGFQIENRTEQENRAVHSFYRLITPATPSNATP
ncbi:hypothetical protein JIN85_17010 [Luteolibacter pohnpeiensis]|uniref:Winged helix-turn-helix domain-containing protein n=1 Tax=Luteolibacter pohnpeiensis TaxID=454153 RepID=A0A934VXR2_9BACT|nr:helix-turn-helix domain-containing protein [Luteolibacter pohnpeiensis]MBK1884123.1 hypothetical protein [Luteolibacter pohnpeiensis]